MFCKVFTVKQQRITFACLMAAGLLCLLAAFLFAPDEYAMGFLCGAGSAVLVIGLVRSIQLWRLCRDPERVADYERSLNEERTISIMNQAMKMTLIVSMVVEYAMGITALLFGNNSLAMVLCWLVVGQAALTLLLRTVYNKYQ